MFEYQSFYFYPQHLLKINGLYFNLTILQATNTILSTFSIFLLIHKLGFFCSWINITNSKCNVVRYRKNTYALEYSTCLADSCSSLCVTQTSTFLYTNQCCLIKRKFNIELQKKVCFCCFFLNCFIYKKITVNLFFYHISTASTSVLF